MERGKPYVSACPSRFRKVVQVTISGAGRLIALAEDGSMWDYSMNEWHQLPSLPPREETMTVTERF